MHRSMHIFMHMFIHTSTHMSIYLDRRCSRPRCGDHTHTPSISPLCHLAYIDIHRPSDMSMHMSTYMPRTHSQIGASALPRQHMSLYYYYCYYYSPATSTHVSYIIIIIIIITALPRQHMSLTLLLLLLLLLQPCHDNTCLLHACTCVYTRLHGPYAHVYATEKFDLWRHS